MNLQTLRHVHCIGIGGINMSAVAKLLLAKGIQVTGSDTTSNEQTDILRQRGVDVLIGHAAEHVGLDVELVLYSSAVPESNPERLAARERGIPEMTNFAFLGEWFKAAQTVLVAGTHGKSTTTAVLGCMATRAGLDPTVIVGTKVTEFPDGNIRIGNLDRLMIEGDEYAKHFLEFSPTVVLLTNLEHDHPDIFPTLDDVIQAFVELIVRVTPKGLLVVNGDDVNVRKVLELSKRSIDEKQLTVVTFGRGEECDWRMTTTEQFGAPAILLTAQGSQQDFWLAVPSLIGAFNQMNVAGAMVVAMMMKMDRGDAGQAIHDFKGIWRRFERLGEKNGTSIFSDYAHHPTAVAATLVAAREAFPERRIVLCFQPHHRNRTKHLFFDFVSSCDAADVLILCEIYDVAGREATEDEHVSSQDLVDAIVRHDADRQVERVVEYASGPAIAVDRALSLSQSGDMIIVMGAGDIDEAIRKKI